MTRALVVDDAKIHRDLVRGILAEDLEFDVAEAADGKQALAAIEERPPELVISDLVMPEMDGFELVSRLRRQHPAIPVIVMTQHGNERLAVQALEAGAASYVRKDDLAYELAKTVSRVLAVSQQAHAQAQLMESLQKSEASFVIDSTGELIAPLVRHLQESASPLGLFDETRLTQLGVGLQEALLNAAHHGNLEVGSELRDEDADLYRRELEKRLGEMPYKERRVHVDAKFTGEEARFTIRDEGPGFDPEALPDPCDPENLLKCHGRGVMLMRSLMDECRYNDAGNAVTLVMRRSNR
ncbi:MAG: ATP-binding response regulator [Planctomycetota bacterium]|jgi:CheY-like chemotaxis protein